MATNEKNTTVLSQLRRYGYIIQSDLISADLNSLESFFLDVYLVGCAHEALMPGFVKFGIQSSSVHKLIHLFRKYHSKRHDVCGRSTRVIDRVSCGKFLAESCGACVSADRPTDGLTFCSGDCGWDEATLTCKGLISCGGHRAVNCASCPLHQGNSYGMARCRGDCAWDEDAGKCQEGKKFRIPISAILVVAFACCACIVTGVLIYVDGG